MAYIVNKVHSWDMIQKGLIFIFHYISSLKLWERNDPMFLSKTLSEIQQNIQQSLFEQYEITTWVIMQKECFYNLNYKINLEKY